MPQKFAPALIVLFLVLILGTPAGMTDAQAIDVHFVDVTDQAGIKLMGEVIRIKPDFADAYYELGKALVQKGEIKDGVANLETAAKLAPDKSYVQYQLGRAYLAAGRKAEGENHLEISRQLKEKERQQTKP